MTVWEMIEALYKLPQDAQVCFTYEQNREYFPLCDCECPRPPMTDKIVKGIDCVCVDKKTGHIILE